MFGSITSCFFCFCCFNCNQFVSKYFKYYRVCIYRYLYQKFLQKKHTLVILYINQIYVSICTLYKINLTTLNHINQFVKRKIGSFGFVRLIDDRYFIYCSIFMLSFYSILIHLYISFSASTILFVLQNLLFISTAFICCMVLAHRFIVCFRSVVGYGACAIGYKYIITRCTHLNTNFSSIFQKPILSKSSFIHFPFKRKLKKKFHRG